ncbi:nickel/cobalt exporter [Escherichia coli]|nr:nickel/cobalt exporter [Escherichia coli]
MKNHSTINLLGGSIRYWGGVESDCRINTKNYYHDRIYHSSSARKRLVLHPQRHLTWCASWPGTRALKNDDGGVYHRHHEHGEYQDAHARAHANDIKRRFDGREVTNWQILLFGLTGGLIPCPAAITVLLICIQLKALTLGATLVVSFSIGLALTLVTVGVGAAISVQQVAKRWSGFNTLAKRAPYFSSLLIGLVGVYMGVHGFMGIMR